MKIGALVNSFRRPLAQALAMASDMGLEGVQLSVNGGETAVEKMTDEKIRDIKSMLKRYNLEISAFCGDMGKPGYCDAKLNPERVTRTKKMIDLAEKMGVKVITTHIGVIPENKDLPTYKALRGAMSELGKYAAEKGVTFAIETGPEIAATLYGFVKDLDGVGVNLDPANFVMVSRQDPVDAVRLIGKKIVHTHAKDGVNLKVCNPTAVYGTLEPSMKSEPVLGRIYKETPLGKGGVNWDAYIAALKEVGYDGFLTIERETRTNPAKTVGQAYDFLCGKLGRAAKIVVAVVGCGNIARGAHFPSIARIPQYRIKYTCDIIPERAEKAARLHGEAGYTKAVTDYHEILRDDEVQAVIVCTHTYMHAKIAVDSMRAGKHVLSEKPAAMTYADAQEMYAVSKETGKISNVAVCMRYDGGVNNVKDFVDAGLLGNVYMVYCSFRAFRNIPGIGGEFTNKSHSGGGVLLDWGVHYLDLIMYILNSPAVLSATGDTFSELGKDISAYRGRKLGYDTRKKLDGINDVEEFVTGLVKTEGATISLNGCWAQNIDKKDTYIDFLGTKGGIRLNYLGRFTFYTYDDKKKVFVHYRPKFKRRAMYYEEHKAFVHDVICGTRSRQYIENVLQTTKLLEDIYKSADEKK